MHVVDHVFVFCDRAAPEQQHLLAAGLRPGVRREHRGQGTANVCFGFLDCYLELLWLEDEAGARNPMVKPLGLQERARWRQTGASPFGVGLRPTGADARTPFVAWPYRPAYLPADTTIQMACNSGVIGEPLLFAFDRPFQPFGIPHPLADRRLAEVAITVPDLAPMSLLREVSTPGLQIRAGDEHLLTLTFAAATGKTIDLRPHLPLVLAC